MPNLTLCQAYAIAYFLPIILRDRMGFNIAASQCLVAPPYAWGAILMYAESWFGDKKHVRGPQILTNCVLGIIGLAILGWTDSVGSQYFGIFLLTGAVQANIPQVSLPMLKPRPEGSVSEATSALSVESLG